MKSLPSGFIKFLIPVGLFGISNFAPTLLILRAQDLLTPSLGAVTAGAFAVGLYTFSNVVYALVAYPMGVLADKFSKRAILSLGFALFGVLCLGFLLADDRKWILVVLSGITGLRGLAQPNRFKIGLRFFGGVAAGLILALAGYISSDLIHDNLRVVAAGQAYRSGQMDAEEFTSVIEHYGIKSILNLRGENPTTSWHQAEIATAAKLNVVHYDRSLGSGRQMTLEQMDDLVNLLRQAPKPILIHCNGGADRSGLVSALYDFAIKGEKPADAEKELSIWNGHVRLIRPKVIAMDNSFWRYVTNSTR